MILLLILLFPALEIYLMIRISELYSFGDVLLYFISMGILGSFLMRMLGSGTLQELQVMTQAGREPSKLLLHRGLMLFGAFLIMIPGVISDVLGVLFLLPGTRHLILWLVQSYLQKKMKSGNLKFFASGAGFGGFSQGFPNPSARREERDATVIDIQALESQTRVVKETE